MSTKEKEINKKKLDKIKSDNTSKRLWSRVDFYSTEASKIARQLAFTEGAIFWSLYFTMAVKPKGLVVLFYIGLILFFLVDLFQYLYGTIKFKQKILARNKAKKDNLVVPSIGDKIGKNIFNIFIIKLILLIQPTITLILIFIVYISS
ncbi:hypothetical protein [Legionella resiliens]|uniref:Uncharacterized protein n=1 Tax=Legionella resiliens TaxID=2905958 RepID=A0ABS8X4A0_9GAMM|nr:MULTISPECIES: hypothetical protein [unclassified Legionella]MCE0722805.1 hypothetical protein [Legionella sp. 9fVS26]MCE3531958.1 hypothetical protein [Legionella sp. 8cVS16]